MPSLNDILLQTMPLTANPGLVNTFLGPQSTADIVTGPIDPRATTLVIRNSDGHVTTPTQPLRRLVNVWSWKHSGSDPASVSDVKSRVLGMLMDYQHPMPVCSEIRLKEVKVTLQDGVELPPLELSPKFVLRKYSFLGDPNQLGRNIGHIPDSGSGFWRLDTNLDQSFMVVFGYQFNQSGPPDPIDHGSTVKDTFMPGPRTGGGIPCAVGEARVCVLGSLKLVVCFSLTCCMENPDFTPGDILGMNRIYPHAMLMSSMELKNADIAISVTRPATTLQHDPEMGLQIGPALFTDSSTSGGAVGVSLPIWQNMFDYYEVDPIGHGVGVGSPLVVVDGDPASKRSSRRGPTTGLVKKFQSTTAIRKFARQGEFDNLHVAPKMVALPVGPAAIASTRASLGLDRIVMAPFCFHDCLHTHWRWGDLGYTWVVAQRPMPKSTLGFDTNFSPNTTLNAPLVPHNQSIRLTLLPPAGFSYEAFIHGPINAGQWQVVFHHGMGYANELWDADLMDGVIPPGARFGVEALATAGGEFDFTPRSARNSFAIFYWRLRFGIGTSLALAEKIEILNLAGCRSL